MKQNLTLLTVSVLMLINITGCSVVRFAETRTGYGMKRINKTTNDLDFQLGFDAKDQSLSITLEYQPYEIHKPRITLTDLGVGLAALGLLGKVVYDNWDHDYTFTFLDDTFDWYGSEPWEKAVMIGVPVDILLYWTFSYPFDRKLKRAQRLPLTEYPYRIELPDHGNIGRDYLTKTGTERLEIAEFLAELGNPSYLRNFESLKFRASTEIKGKQHRRDYTASPIIWFDPPPSQVEIEAQWVVNRIRRGEKATLKVTVKNTNETALTELIVTTISRDRYFDNWELKFDNIAQGTLATRTLGFSTDVEMPPQDVSVRLRFESNNSVVHPEIKKIIHITE